MNNCLLSLVASLPGIITICGLIALLCVVLFDTTRAHGRTKSVKFREPGKIACDIRNVAANPKTSQKDIELDTDDFLVKVKKISPDSTDSTVCLEISPKEEFVPSSQVWQEQLVTNGQEERSSDEQSMF